MHDLRLLNVLREVALRGSFSAAAESLAYTQPAISQQIARLEKHVGVKLIEREPRGVRLTPAGEVLVRHTERVMAQLAAADEELQDVAAQARGRLRIGSFATAAGTIVPRAVAAFRPLRPAIEVEISLLDPHESIPARAARRPRDRDHGGGRLRERGRHRRPPDRAPARRPHVGLAAGRPPARDAPDRRPRRPARRGLDVRLPERHLRGLQRRAARVPDAGFQPRIAYQSDDYFAIQGLVASGMGVALIPGLGLASTRDDVAVRPVKGRPPYRRVAAVTAGEPTGGAIPTMLECLRDAGAVYAESGLAAAA